MSETTNLKLKKHDNVTTNTNQFDVENYMNGNWDKLDEFAGQVNGKTAELQEATIALQAELLATKKDYEAGTLEGQEEGESLYLQDSSNARFREFGIGGNDKQATRSGKNKLDLSKIQQRTLNGVTCTYNAENKSVTLNGTCTADNTGFAIGDSGLATKKLVKDKTTLTAYYVSGECTGTGTMSVQAHATGYVSNVPLTDLRDLKELKLRTATYSSSNFPEMELMMVNVRVNEEAILDNFTFKLMLTDEVDEVDTEYEDFGAMPSLEFPSETEAVGQDVNLFDKDNVEFYNNNSSNFSCTINAGPTRVRTSSFEFAGEGPYTLSGLIGKTRLLGVRAYGENENIISEGATLNENTFTLTEEVKYIHLLFKNSDDSELNREEVRNMPIKIEKGKQASAYSKYNCGSANITVCNKNTLDFSKWDGITAAHGTIEKVENGIKLTATEADCYSNSFAFRYQGTLNKERIEKYGMIAKQNTKYTFSCKVNSSSISKRLYMFFADKDFNNISSISSATSALTAVTPENCRYITVRVGVSNAGDSLIFTDFQLEEGSTATDYIEHEEQTFTIDVQQEMLEGDYFDLDNEEEVHTWGKVIFDGTENWAKSINTNNILFYIPDIFPYKDGTILCNYFKAKDVWDKDVIGIQLYPVNGVRFGLGVNSSIDTVDKWKAKLQELYNAGNPLTIYYKLAEPTRLPFTAEQKAIAKQIRETLHSYKGGTHVYSTDSISPIFNAKYTVDQKAYIQAEINKMQAMILAE